jgi:hypothetical protein
MTWPSVLQSPTQIGCGDVGVRVDGADVGVAVAVWAAVTVEVAATVSVGAAVFVGRLIPVGVGVDSADAQAPSTSMRPTPQLVHWFAAAPLQVAQLASHAPV